MVCLYSKHLPNSNPFRIHPRLPSCYAFSDINQLDELLYKVLSGDDYLVESRKKAIDYLIGYEETLNKEFVNQLKSLEAQDVSSLPSRAYDF